jgi:hypothetical protein
MGPRFRMGRRRGLLVGAAVGASVANAHSNKQETQQPITQPANNNDEFAQLEKLGQLRDQGILTQEEFDAKKKQILGI